MTFDPSTVDLSFVEPALREEVLRRIVLLEEFIGTRGPAARRKARRELGLSDWQLNNLAKAWRSRRRAEDITLRATKRSKPSSVHPDVLAMIAAVTDEDPSQQTRVIAQRVEAMAQEAGHVPPSYPTVSRYVRERLAESGGAIITRLGCDLAVDVIVSDIPVRTPMGGGVRPHLVTVIDGRTPRLVSLAGTVGTVTPADLARGLERAVQSALDAPESNAAPVAQPFSISLPMLGSLDLGPLVHAIEEAGIMVETRSPSDMPVAKLATALLGVSIAGYRLRPRLVGRPEKARASTHARIEPAPLDEAIDYIATMAEEGREPRPSPLSRLRPDILTKLALSLRRVAVHQLGRSESTPLSDQRGSRTARAVSRAAAMDPDETPQPGATPPSASRARTSSL